MYPYIKRFVDILLCIIGLAIFAPVYIILAIAIKLDSKGPILFKQKRVGLNKVHFNILKFRTMHIDTPSDLATHLLEDPDKWITRPGRFMRRVGLDELPQIFNILKGDMSIIGPRPALWNQYDLIEERDKYGANDIRPGLTGLAQINGREIPIEIKAKLDGIYAENRGPWLDTLLFFGTFTAILRYRGIIEGGTDMLAKYREGLFDKDFSEEQIFKGDKRI